MAKSEIHTDNEVPAGASKAWNFHPKLPIAMSPVFDIPPKPCAALSWLIGTWFKLAPPLSHIVLAVIIVAFLLPAMEVMRTLDAGWMLQIAAINFGFPIVLGAALHTYLYVFAGQQMRLKFDVRPMEKSSRFTFGNQVWDNVFWSLASSVVFWTLWTILYFHVAANGWVPTLTSIGHSPIWFVAFFFILRFWQSFNFYWIHRLIHIPFLFKHVHSLHRRNVNVGPWSGLASLEPSGANQPNLTSATTMPAAIVSLSERTETK